MGLILPWHYLTFTLITGECYATDSGLHHFWGSEVFFAELEGHPRHLDQLWPLWNVLDLTPMGRGTDWFPALDYPA